MQQVIYNSLVGSLLESMLQFSERWEKYMDIALAALMVFTALFLYITRCIMHKYK
jgi:hypothetical protein